MPTSRPRRRAPALAAPPPAAWTFLTNHAHVALTLAIDPTLVMRAVAARVGITERAVQRIVADLEEAGYLRRTRDGRQNVYEVRGELPLRHPIEAHRTLGALVRLVTERPAPRRE